MFPDKSIRVEKWSCVGRCAKPAPGNGFQVRLSVKRYLRRDEPALNHGSFKQTLHCFLAPPWLWIPSHDPLIHLNQSGSLTPHPRWIEILPNQCVKRNYAIIQQGVTNVKNLFIGEPCLIFIFFPMFLKKNNHLYAVNVHGDFIVKHFYVNMNVSIYPKKNDS
ncbi:unnamed protein product [Timema podura]|uniref:Uncharacterized protein n=1 Tax=Timema podura TaxID=61482 RepID=A0ABN7NZK3_TIMPD|nr:unnamed protein product [Timema podura]